jgi:Rod binding domain-containing protein
MSAEIFTEMLDEAVAGEAAKSEGMGLAAALYENLRRAAGTE